jgi:hypothetical protein
VEMSQNESPNKKSVGSVVFDFDPMRRCSSTIKNRSRTHIAIVESKSSCSGGSSNENGPKNIPSGNLT